MRPRSCGIRLRERGLHDGRRLRRGLSILWNTASTGAARGAVPSCGSTLCALFILLPSSQDKEHAFRKFRQPGTPGSRNFLYGRREIAAVTSRSTALLTFCRGLSAGRKTGEAIRKPPCCTKPSLFHASLLSRLTRQPADQVSFHHPVTMFVSRNPGTSASQARHDCRPQSPGYARTSQARHGNVLDGGRYNRFGGHRVTCG